MYSNAKVLGEITNPADYHHQKVNRGDPGYAMGRSDLMDFAFCPERWKNGATTEDTTATIWGSLIDCIVLQPTEFNNRYAVSPATYTDEKTGKEKPWTFSANVCKQWREDQGGKQIVKEELWGQAKWAHSILTGTPRVQAFLDDSQNQLMATADWTDRETKVVVPVKVLIDIVPGGKHVGALADLKTARCAHPGPWARVAWSMGYDAQAALYLDVWNAATGDERQSWYWVVQENQPPYQPAVLMASQEMIELGRNRYRQALGNYARCVATGLWPGYEIFGRMILDQIPVIEPLPWMLTDLSQFPNDQWSDDSTDEDAKEPEKPDENDLLP